MKFSFLYIAICFFCVVGAIADTNVNADILADQIWDEATGPYIIQKDINIEANLIIKPGTTVKFSKNTSLIVKGSIVAQGFLDSKIQFTANASNPVSGFWNAIKFETKVGAKASILDYCEISYGGATDLAPLIYNTTVTPSFSNIYYNSNKNNGIKLTATALSATTILNKGVYIIYDNLTVPVSADLIIKSGVSMKFAVAKYLTIKGSIKAGGSKSNPVLFTSINDDSDGVDSDGGGSSTGFAGAWGALVLEGAKAGSVLRSVAFKYGGGLTVARQAELLISASSPKVEGCSFESSAAYGVFCVNAANPDFGGGALNCAGFNEFIGFKSPKVAFASTCQNAVYALNNCWDASNSADIKKILSEKPGKINFEPFNTNCQPPAPIAPNLVYPVNLSKGMPIDLFLKWNKADAEYYKIQVAADANFNDIKYSSDYVPDSSFALLGLQYNTRYYWRVKTVDWAGESDWCNYFAFKTYDVNKPVAPQIISPNNNASVSCEFAFIWSQIENADTYTLEIATNSGFTKIVKREENIADTSITLTGLSNDGDYFVRVKAINRNGESDWTEPTYFIAANSFAINFATKLGFIPKIVSPIDLLGNNKYSFVICDTGAVYLFKQNGLNYDKTPILDKFNVSSLKLSDLDGDNLPEIYLTGKDNDGIYKIIRLTYKVPNFLKTVLYSSASTSSKINDMAIVPADSAGVPSIYFIENKSLTRIFLFKSGDIKSEKIYKFSEEYDKLFAKDIYSDGYTDFLCYGENSAKVCVFKRSKNGNEALEYDLSNKPQDLIIENISADGNVDIITLEFNKLVKYRLGIGATATINLDFIPTKMLMKDYNYASEYEVALSSENKSELYPTTIPLQKLKESDIFDRYKILSCFDITGDRKPEFICSSNDTLFIGVNSYCAPQIPTPAPINLRYSFSGDNIVLEWNLPEEYVYKKTALFNIRIGTDPGKSDILSASANGATGRAYCDLDNLKSRNIYIINSLNSGVYYWSVQTVDRSGAYSEFSNEDSYKTKDLASTPPANWAYEQRTGLNTLLFIRDTVNTIINGRHLADGDAIGAFYVREDSLICAGYSLYREGKNCAVTVWGDNLQTPNIKDGFNQLESIRLMIWDSQKSAEVPVDYIIESGYKYYIADTLTSIKAFIPLDTLKIAVEPGLSNYVSTNIIPFFPAFRTILTDRIQLIRDVERKYYENHYNSNIKFWNELNGYEVFSQSADTIRIIGTKIKSSDYFVPVRANSAILVPYLSSNATDCEEVFDMIKESALLVKNENGEIYSDKYGIKQFDTIKPGKAYKIIALTRDSLLYGSPYSGNSPRTTDDFRLEYYTPKYTRTGSECSMIVKCSGFSPGDEIAVVSASNQILGAGKINSNGIAAFTVWGDNELTKAIIEGSIPGEKIYFRYKPKSSVSEYKLGYKSIKEESGQSGSTEPIYGENFVYFMETDWSKVTDVKEEIVEDEINIVAMYNSPNREINIEVKCKSEGFFDLAIYNRIGEKVRSISGVYNGYGKSKINFDAKNLPSGSYFIKAISGNNATNEKLLIVND